MEFAGLLGQTLLLGLGAAVTPSLLALQILVCSQDPWRRRALAVAAGGALAFGAVGGLLFFGFAQLPVPSGDTSTSGIVLRLASAVGLGLLAVWLFIPHPAISQRAQRDIEGYVERASTWVFFGVAFLLSIKDLSSFIMLAPALHDIAVAPLDVILQAALLLVLYTAALSPVLAPPVARWVFGHRVDDLFQAVYRFTMAHQFPIVGVIASAIALYLGATGVLAALRSW